MKIGKQGLVMVIRHSIWATALILLFAVKSISYGQSGHEFEVLFQCYDYWISDLYTYNSVTNEIKQITFDDVFETDPSWSHDGTSFTYVRDGTQLYVVSTQGDQVQNLTADHGKIVSPVWSPDDRAVAFIQQDLGWNDELHVWHLDSNESQVIASGRLRDLAWSPDGGWIAYVNGPDALYRIRPNGTERHLMLLGSSVISYPVWSPDGASIAYINQTMNETSLYSVDVDTIDAQLLLRGNAIHYPAWSPDGEYLAASYRVSVSGSEMAIVDRSGNLLQVTHEKGVHWWPQFLSNDLLLYVASSRSATTTTTANLHSMDPINGTTEQLTHMSSCAVGRFDIRFLQ